jgi:hypothetical protein
MRHSAPPKPEHVNGILVGLIAIMTGIPSALCWIFFFG